MAGNHPCKGDADPRPPGTESEGHLELKERCTGHSFLVYWAPFFLAAGAPLLGIPVYLGPRRHMSQPAPFRPTGDTGQTSGEREKEDMTPMDETERPVSAPPQKYLTVRQAAFIGVGAMVGAGIFARRGRRGRGGGGMGVVLDRRGHQRRAVPGARAVRAAGGNAAVPPLMARKFGGRLSAGLLFEAVACLVLAVLFKLDAIASIGSAVALVIFTLITAAHFRVRSETGANALVLALAIAAAAVVLVTFVFTTLIHEPASVVALLAVLALSIGLDLWWKRVRAGRTGGGTASDVQVGH